MTATWGNPIDDRPAWYRRLRYEDAPFSPWRVGRSIGYLVKYWRKRPGAPAAVVDRFNRLRDASRAATVPPADFTIAAVGDILWVRRGYERLIHESLAPALKADLTVGNLETPVCPSRPVPGVRPEVIRENVPTAVLDTLARFGFNVLSVANNHCLDQGPAGLAETPEEVRRAGMLPVAGREAVTVTCGGLRAACLAFTTFVNRRRGLTAPDGMLLRPSTDERRAFLDAVRAARADGPDLVIVSAHWGYEHEFLPDPWQIDLARDLAEAGADVVLGHHPHVVQPAEFVTVPGDPPRRTVVLYSLGNFASVMFGLTCRVGVVARLGFGLGEGRPRITSVSFTPTIVRVGRGWRTDVLALDAAEAEGVPPRRLARADALVRAQTPLILTPPTD